MVLVKTKRKIGSAGYASQYVRDTRRAGTTAAGSYSESSQANVAKSNAEYEAYIKTVAEGGGTPPAPTEPKTVIVGISKNKETGGYQASNLSAGLTPEQVKQVKEMARQAATTGDRLRATMETSPNTNKITRAEGRATTTTMTFNVPQRPIIETPAVVTPEENLQPKKETIEWVERYFNDNPTKDQISYAEKSGNTFTFTRSHKVYGTLMPASDDTRAVMERERTKEKLMGTENYTFFLNQEQQAGQSYDYYKAKVQNWGVKLGWVPVTNGPDQQISALANKLLKTDAPQKWTAGKIAYNVGAIPYDVSKTVLVDYPIYAPSYSTGKIILETVTTGGGNVFNLGYGIYDAFKRPRPESIRTIGGIAGVIAVPTIVAKPSGAKQAKTVNSGIGYNELPPGGGRGVWQFKVRRGGERLYNMQQSIKKGAKSVRAAASEARTSGNPLDFYAYKGRRPSKAGMRAKTLGQAKKAPAGTPVTRESTGYMKGQPPINIKETQIRLPKKGGVVTTRATTQQFNNDVTIIKKGRTKVIKNKLTKTGLEVSLSKVEKGQVFYGTSKGEVIKAAKSRRVVTPEGVYREPIQGTSRTRSVTRGGQLVTVKKAGTRLPKPLPGSTARPKLVEIFAPGGLQGSRQVLIRTQKGIIKITKSRKPARPASVQYIPRNKTRPFTSQISKGFEAQLKKAGLTKSQYRKVLAEDVAVERAQVLQYQKGGYRAGMRERLKIKVDALRSRINGERAKGKVIKVTARPYTGNVPGQGQPYVETGRGPDLYGPSGLGRALSRKRKPRLIEAPYQETGRPMEPITGPASSSVLEQGRKPAMGNKFYQSHVSRQGQRNIQGQNMGSRLSLGTQTGQSNLPTVRQDTSLLAAQAQVPASAVKVSQSLAVASALNFGNAFSYDFKAGLVSGQQIDYQATPSQVRVPKVLPVETVKPSGREEVKKVPEDKGKGGGGGTGKGGGMGPGPPNEPYNPPRLPESPYNPPGGRIRDVIIEPPRKVKPVISGRKTPLESVRGQGYNVFVRRQGKFRLVSPKPLSKEDALSFGANVVRSTAAATFKIVPSYERVKGKFRGPPALLHTFLKKGSLFIQPRRQRIGSMGEKREITFKGIASSKHKKNKNRWLL